MKFRILIFNLIVTIFLCCTQKPSIPESPELITRSVTCYEYLHKKDSIYLKTYRQKDSIFGTLNSNSKLLGKSIGDISGNVIDSILWVNYKFDSAGTIITKEMSFKISDNYLIPGQGKMQRKNNYETFIDRNNINFADSLSLEVINCR